ncbi:hypothetical protein H8959_003264 [Pygathrix nigripes]
MSPACGAENSTCRPAKQQEKTTPPPVAHAQPSLAPPRPIRAPASVQVPGARRLSSSPARRLALPYQAEPLGARSAGPPGEYVRSLAARAPTPSAPVAFPIERKSRGVLPGPWAGRLCTFPPTGCPVPLLAAPANVPQVGNQTLQPLASLKEAQTDVAG